MALADMSLRLRIECSHHLRLPHVLAIVTGLTGVAGLLLAALQGWRPHSGRQRIRGLARSTRRQMQSSTLLTRSARAVALEHPWRMMGALEAVDGMLLFGISTAYIFAVMQAYWPLMTRRLSQSKAPT